MPEIIGSTGNVAVSAKIIYTLTQSIENNSSTIAATLYLYRPDDGTWTSYGSTNVTMTIGSNSQTQACYFNVGHNGAHDWQAIMSYTQTIQHNADGSHAAVTVGCTSSGSGTTVDPITVSGTVSLPTIARASQPTCPASAAFGDTILIATNRVSASFTHTLVITMAAGSGGTAQSTTISAVEAARNFTIPTSWAAAIPKATVATLVVTCTTYSGVTQIGTPTTCSCSVSIPSGWTPSVSLAAAVYNGFNGLYLQGKSAVTLTASSGAATTGATIQSYKFSGSGISKTVTTSSANPAAQTTSTLTTAGSLTYTVTITDSRGKTKSATATITCTAYTAPSITMTVTRCDSGGTADDYGEYAKATVIGKLSTVTGNAATIQVGYKILGDPSYTGLNTWSNLTSATNTKTTDVFAAAAANQYEIRATITDTVGRSAFVVLTVPTAYAIMDVYQDEVVAFGAQAGPTSPGTGNRVHMAVPFADDEMYAQNNNGFGWGRLFNDNYTGYGLRGASLTGKQEGSVADNTDFNTLLAPGTYFIRSNASAATMTNCPSTKAGILFVLSGNGSIATGTYSYREQIYVVALTGSDRRQYWERIGNTGNSNTWTWTTWSPVSKILDSEINLSTLTQNGANFVLDNSSNTTGTAVRVKNALGDVGLYSGTNRGIYDYIVNDWMVRRNFMDGVEIARSPSSSMLLGTSYVSPYIHDTGWITDPTATWIKYRRLNDTIFFSVITSSTVTIQRGAYRNITTIPEQFRPTWGVYFPCFVANTSDLVLVYIPTNGKVQMRNIGTSDSVNVRGSSSYCGQTFKKDSNNAFYAFNILSYNVGNWGDGTTAYGDRMTEADYNSHIAGIKRMFNQISPDVAVFTEYVTYMDKDLTHSARTELFPSGTYQGYLDENWSPRPCLVTKTAVTQDARSVLTPDSGRQYLLAHTTLAGYEIYILCVHLDPSSAAIRSAEMDAALAIAANYDNIILAGDFNFEPASYSGTDEHKTQFAKAKAAGFEMANGDFLPWTGTWPTEDNQTYGPRQSWFIDNILTKGRVKILAATVPLQAHNYMLTDHFPILATVGIIGE